MNSISPNLNLMIKACEKASKVINRDFGEIENLQVAKKEKILLQKQIKELKKFLLMNLVKLRKIIHL